MGTAGAGAAQHPYGDGCRACLGSCGYLPAALAAFPTWLGGMSEWLRVHDTGIRTFPDMPAGSIRIPWLSTIDFVGLPERRQVHPLQRADQERRARSELSVRDDRAERRCGEPADSRLNVLAGVFGSERILPATVSFVDIAGIVRGASEGEGLGNQFLANIREGAMPSPRSCAASPMTTSCTSRARSTPREISRPSMPSSCWLTCRPSRRRFRASRKRWR